MKSVTIYTDGACSGNPGPGGWAAVMQYGKYKKEMSGGEAETTNNRMELKAALCALQALKEPCVVDIYTDSTYLQHAFEKHWLDNWQRNGWKTSQKQPVENRDIWEQLLEQANVHRLTFHKVKGHADDELNNRCDELARGQIKAFRSKAEIIDQT